MNPLILAREILTDLQANIYQATDEQLKEICQLKASLEELEQQTNEKDGF